MIFKTSTVFCTYSIHADKKCTYLYIHIYVYIYIYGYIHSDNTSMMITHTHLGCLILTTSGLKRSCGSFSSCNPCRWMLRSCKCWRIQENILGGSMEERKKIRGTQRPVFCWEVGKNPWVPKKICGSTPTWFLFLFFDRHHVFFFRRWGSYISLSLFALKAVPPCAVANAILPICDAQITWLEAGPVS